MSNIPKPRPVASVPPPSTTRKGDLDWDGYAQTAVENPNQDFHISDDILETRVKSARTYTRWPFSSSQLRIMLRNSYVDDDGLRRGSVYIRYDKPEEQEGQ